VFETACKGLNTEQLKHMGTGKYAFNIYFGASKKLYSVCITQFE
jgi:hypothetical protein